MNPKDFNDSTIKKEKKLTSLEGSWSENSDDLTVTQHAVSISEMI